MAGLYKDIATGETIKKFRASEESNGWYNAIPSYDSSVADNGTINMAEIGASPDVLINNTTYPLNVQTRTDGAKVFQLNKFQTEVTAVTEDELKGLTYDKQSSVLNDHAEQISETKYEHALHALAPASDSAKTPVVKTTAGKVTVADIIKLKAKFDALKIPRQGRILVLSTKHANDLLEQDTTFAQRYNNATTGAIANLYGFDIYESPLSPYYTSAGAKKAFGAVVASGDLVASVAFYAPRCMKADGETTAYIDEPTATTQQWQYAVRHYSVCLPKVGDAIGAII